MLKFVGMRAAPRTQLQARRLDLGYTQSDLAREAGLNPSTISRWENGSRHGNYRLLSRVARIVDVPAARLLAPVEARR